MDEQRQQIIDQLTTETLKWLLELNSQKENWMAEDMAEQIRKEIHRRETGNK